MTFPSSVSESDRRATTLRRVARERAREGHVAAAFALFRRALELTEAREDPRAAADACWDAAAALDAAGDARGARYYAEQARTLYIALQDWRKVNRLYDLLGRLPVPAAA
jgi:hypothetical protein